jgi:WD40 repeat protein
LWAAPIGELRHISLATQGQQAIAVAANAVYVLDTDSGRILKSHPVSLAPNGPVASDPSAEKIAFLDSGNKAVVLDVESGAPETISDTPAAPTQFAWSNDGALLLVGGSDGSVLAWAPGAGRKWLVPTIFSRAFQATAWPGQPPQGVVLNLALSHDGKRFAVTRQDMPTVDLHDLTDGHLLTQLTPPWTTLKVPAHIAFGPNDELVTAWAVHAMARQKPRFVTVHSLPRNFEEALARASARLAALNTTWSPAGPQPASARGGPER